MTFPAPFRRIFPRPMGGDAVAAAVPWWAGAIAAYQPKGAASLAASYVNLANPGTYNAAPGTAPNWDVTNGWIFTRTSSQYLTTGITITSRSWSMLIKFSGTSSNDSVLAGCYILAGNNGFSIYPYYTDNKHYYGNGLYVGVAGGISSGVLAIAGLFGYLNGLNDATISNQAGSIANTLHIGRENNGGPNYHYLTGNIQAMAVYNSVLTPAEVATKSALMAAL